LPRLLLAFPSRSRIASRTLLCGPFKIARAVWSCAPFWLALGARLLQGLSQALHVQISAIEPSRLLLASPVAPQAIADILSDVCDDAVFLATPKELISVGMYYKEFHQLHDDEVKNLLNRA
jgi:hypothetical protein